MKKLFSLLLTISIVLTGVFNFSLVASASGWSVTPVSPSQDGEGFYLIESPAHFMWLQANPTSKCRLVNDIVIGQESNPFTTPFPFNGTLIGYDTVSSKETKRTITAYISATGQHTGLFSEATSLITIKNIVIQGSITLSTSTDKYTGGLYGQIGVNVTGSVIENCDNYATVTGTTQVGGIVGRHHSGYTDRLSIKNCRNFGAISTTSTIYAGGIAGVTDASVSYCANMGKVTAKTQYAGGIVGWVTGKTFNQNYNQGEIKAADYAAGLIGKADNVNLKINNCYNTGSVTAAGAAGIATYPNKNATISNCYNTGTVTGTNSSQIYGNNMTGAYTADHCYYLNNGAAGKANTTSFEASDKITLAGWNFSTDFWTMGSGSYTYPQLIGNLHYIAITPADGTANNPYLIIDQASFEKIATAPSACYKLTNKITLVNYTPISFSGTLKADSLTEIDLSISSAGTNVGLFSTVTGTVVIENIKLTGSVSGGATVGGFIGLADGVTSLTVTNCVNEASITSTGTYAGGLVGRSYGTDNKATITNFKNYGDIIAYQHAGGVGGLLSGKIKYAANFGSIQATDIKAGGICSWMTGGSIDQSFNIGTISAKGLIGGLIAVSQYSNIAITNSYNAGNVLNTNSPIDVGAIVGQVSTFSVTATNCYNIGYISGINENQLFGTGTFGPSNSYFVAPNGDMDEIAESVSLATMKNLASTLGSSIFNNTTNDFKFPQLKDNINPTSFELYLVSVSQPENGAITPSGTFYYNTRDNLKINVAGAEGYYVDTVYVNSAEITMSEFNVKVTQDTAISALIAKIPSVEIAVIQSEVAELPISAASPIFETGDEIQTQNGLITLDSSTTYSVAMATIKDFQGWTLNDYGICMDGVNYSATSFIKDYKYGVLFYGNKIQKGNTITVKLYACYTNNETEEILTVYGKEDNINI